MTRSARLVLAALSVALGMASPASRTSGTPVLAAPPVLAAATTPRHHGFRAEVGFRSHGLLVEHYRKHGREFGSISMPEYLRRAQELRERPLGGPVLEIVRADGVRTRYDRASGSFLAFEQDGTIRTFFRPRQGEAYFRRQAMRPARSR